MKRVTVVVLILSMIMTSMLTNFCYAKSEPSQLIGSLIEQGIIKADSKYVKSPNTHVTRKDVYDLISATVGLSQIDKKMLEGIEDVKWILEKDLGNKLVSRQEMILISAALLKVSATDGENLSQAYIDLSGIAEWAQKALPIVLKKEIFIGYKGKLRPLAKITFTELISVINKIIEANKKSLFSELNFEDGKIPSFVTTADASMEIVNNSTGSKALKVNYNAADFPTVKFTAQKPWDFGVKSALSFEVTNPTDKVITFYLRIDDDPTADGSKHSTVTTIVAQPGKTDTVFFSLSSEALDYGMRNLPVTKAGRQLAYSWGEKDLNEHNIVQFQLWQMFITQGNSLIFDNIKIVPDPNSDLSSMNNLIDEYGQYTGLNWEDKVTSDADLTEDRISEEKVLAASKPMKVSKYGGWADGPKLEVTGRFRVTKYEGKWSLVDPEGYLFFATGLDVARLADMNTWVTGRENMFKNVPPKDGPLGDHYSYTTYVARAPLGLTEGWLFNHYSANLERKYGQDYLNSWKEISIKRFKDWGFSTLGNWSEPELFFGKGNETQLAYVANGWSTGKHSTIPSGNPYWAPVADPFDPEFVNSVNKMIDDQILRYGVADDEWCMGVYIDNETAWGDPSDTQRKYALITSIFAEDASTATSFAKRAMISLLKDKYNDDIQALNKAWGTSLASFAELQAPYKPSKITEAMVPDYSAMLYRLADKYFCIVDSALSLKLPDTLYLGSRFAEWGTSLEVQQAAAKYVDVISFNVYKEDVESESWMHLQEIDKPAIVGEFHFGSTDRGMFGGGLVNASSQENRGEKYIHYMSTVAQSPYFVGAHWFQYVDQPLLGRAWDGENYNVGFVDVTDIPYKSLVDSAKLVHSKVFDIKYKGYDIEQGTKDNVVEKKYSFEDGEDMSIFKAYKDAKTTVSNNGATDGSKALTVNVGKLDTDYAGIEIKPAVPWNMGKNPKVTMDVTNPGTQSIQIRSNVVDGNGAVRTYYFPVSAGETRTITIQNMGASADSWGPDGYWGANDGLDTSNIALMNLYLWEDKTDGSGNEYIIDNVRILMVEPNTTPKSKIVKASFEDGEDVSMFNAYKDAQITYVTQGVTAGTKAMSVKVGALDTDYSGINIIPKTPWNMGDKPKITLDVTNPGTKDIQIRSNVQDESGTVRTFYFPIAAGQTRTITMENLGAAADSWGTDGFWGANNGMDTYKIKLMNLYLWEDKTGGSGDTFIIDNLSIVVAE